VSDHEVVEEQVLERVFGTIGMGRADIYVGGGRIGFGRCPAKSMPVAVVGLDRIARHHRRQRVREEAVGKRRSTRSGERHGEVG